ncbi:DMT family transporter [Oceanicella sp. SM1341]|uniref:aromatic amino acid exporter YddG n=1 Tax=Oceanicella sp. SM1341 TaxID=1548889 RepID=UPI000E4E1911|nr:EamA family transporter [Oceanicella sp. SM1341]
MSRQRATLIGGIAILLWASLALFSVGAAPVPPFQLNAMCFAVGALVGLAWMRAGGRRIALPRLAPRVWALGVVGLFGYHALYFTALRNAPPAAAGLIAYLWPLLIVIFSGLLPGERLRWPHLAGALVSLAGVAVLLGGGAGFGAGNTLGYAAAFACALFWSGYSVLSRRVGDVPTDCVMLFCAVTALLSVPFHLAFEETAWPVGAAGWASVLALGLGPVGLAFYVWDVGVKRGDIQLLGVLSYAAPLLSTLLLIVTGVAAAEESLAIAALLVVSGAALAAWGSARR